MTVHNIDEVFQDLRASCCTTEQLEGYVQGTLGPVTHEYVALHLEEHCDLCRASLEYVKVDLAQRKATGATDSIWTQITEGVSRLIEPISLTISELGMRIHSGGLTPSAASSMLGSEGLSISGHRELRLSGERTIDLKLNWSCEDAVNVLFSPRQAMRARVSLEQEGGACHAVLQLTSTLEIELAPGSWVIRLKPSDDAEEREIPIVISADN